ncbi:MAG: TIGR04283 family arsenosugar biosynthesis glycosyltransferase [Ignavibacteriales bacterium]|nr:TIGR04283 family arsenosugar biosynthesis glycosyltransferase [Ignavibacteriales bacterium]
MISIIIPTYNEESVIERTLQNLNELECISESEIIVVDGGSSDQTVKKTSKYVKSISSIKGKAIQLNTGARTANGDILFFVHADMQLPADVLKVVDTKINRDGFDGGGFLNEFSTHNKKIKTLGRILNFRIINKEQSDRKIFYGDNGIFVKKSVFEKLGGFKEIPIMEDYDFSIRLKKEFNVVKIDEPKIIVDSRRHINSGFIKTRLQWILIRKLYKLGVSPFLLSKLYKDIR